jgi:hypothetical protein
MPLPEENTVDTFDNEYTLEQFVIQVPTVQTSVCGESIKDIFHREAEAEGVVLTEKGCPAGIIMRTTFFQKMGTLYGHSLYSKRPAGILMETDFMKADLNDNISKIGIQSMSREPGKLYDYIVVYKTIRISALSHTVVPYGAFKKKRSSNPRPKKPAAKAAERSREGGSAPEGPGIPVKHGEQSARPRGPGFFWFDNDLGHQKRMQPQMHRHF